MIGKRKKRFARRKEAPSKNVAMAVPTIKELKGLDSVEALCDVELCLRPACYSISWAFQTKVVCTECCKELADREWHNVSTLFGKKMFVRTSRNVPGNS